MIEIIVKNYLDSKLNVPVVLETPNGDTQEYVIFHVTSRGETNHINEVTIEFECVSDSKYNAAVLDEALRSAMKDIIVLDSISASKFGGGGDDNDTTNKRYCYRSYFNLFY